MLEADVHQQVAHSLGEGEGGWVLEADVHQQVCSWTCGSVLECPSNMVTSIQWNLPIVVTVRPVFLATKTGSWPFCTELVSLAAA